MQEKKNIECKNSLKILGVNDYIFEERFCTQFDTYPLLNIVKSIENQISIFKPNLVFTHNPSEVNIDHRITHNAVEVATRPKKNSFIKEVYSFEIVCSGNWKFNKNFSPTTYVDISKFMKRKLKAGSSIKMKQRIFHFLDLERFKGISKI